MSATYKKQDLTRIEYTFKLNAKGIDKAGISDKGDNLHFSYSSDDGLTSSPDEADVLVAMMMALSEYDGKSGITYSDDEGSSIRKVNFVADFTKTSADLTSDYDGMTMEEVEAKYTSLIS